MEGSVCVFIITAQAYQVCQIVWFNRLFSTIWVFYYTAVEWSARIMMLSLCYCANTQIHLRHMGPKTVEQWAREEEAHIRDICSVDIGVEIKKMVQKKVFSFFLYWAGEKEKKVIIFTFILWHAEI